MKSWKIILVLVLILVIVLLITVKTDSPKISRNQIAIIPITGTLSTRGVVRPEEIDTLIRPIYEAHANVFTTKAVATKIDSLEKANSNNNVKAIILEINSPGGTVVASKEVAEAVAKSKKPTVAFIREIGTSGAYWVASSADYIVSDELSITGSIGVLSSYLEFSGFLQEHNVNYQELTAGKYKELGNPFKELTPEEETIMKDKLVKIQDVFLREIQSKRKLKNIEDIKTGKFYLSFEAKELGLVDELGNKETAVKKAKELAGIDHAELTRYESKKTIFDLFSALSSNSFYSMGKGIGEELKIDTDKSPVMMT
ncbi:signal peptide peptidase SppA [Candidatus Woesearchaeota archaeon]|nr:signal peptide peptidase SppA [Candidatus Woesearchaeota archaeon]